MARQRVRENSTWSAAKAALKDAQYQLAEVACKGEAQNTVEHWKLVGRYRAMQEILWEQDR